MGLFTRKKKKEPKKQLPWKLLDSLSQLDEIEEISKNKLVAIFKHSTRCGTSRMALRGFERDYNLDIENVELYILDLLNYREVSNKVAEKFQVFHQSPQLILIKDGVAVNHASHYQISAESIEAFL